MLWKAAGSVLATSQHAIFSLSRKTKRIAPQGVRSVVLLRWQVAEHSPRQSLLSANRSGHHKPARVALDAGAWGEAAERPRAVRRAKHLAEVVANVLGDCELYLSLRHEHEMQQGVNQSKAVAQAADASTLGDYTYHNDLT